MHEIVDLETGRAARGVRIVVAALLPSPWTEAAKGVLHLGGIDTKWVRFTRDPALGSWTHTHNTPVVMHDDDAPRTSSADIVTLAARLSRVTLVPSAAEDRARHFGWIHELAGEDGLGWCARLWMMDAGLTSEGQSGFSVPVARYLAPKYGYAEGRLAHARERIMDILGMFERVLGEKEYVAGDAPMAIDVYLATFLAMLVGVSEQECPAMRPELRAAFDTIRGELAVPSSLVAHRRRMYERHLPMPIPL